jgi:hypothetical protein
MHRWRPKGSPDAECCSAQENPSRPSAQDLSARVPEWCARTGWSRAKTFEQMAAGKLRYRQDAPGAPREIFTSEYVRLGFVSSLDQLN